MINKLDEFLKQVTNDSNTLEKVEEEEISQKVNY